MNDGQVFSAALQFLARVDIKGHEALAMAQVQQRLAQLVQMAQMPRAVDAQPEDA